MLPSAPIIVDLADLNFWQFLFAGMGALGLSPLPWLAGMAAGKIQFTTTVNARIAEINKAHDARVADLKDHHAKEDALQEKAYGEMKESRDGYKIATQTERERADRATDALGGMVEAVGAATHVISAVNEVAQQKTGGVVP